MNRSRPLTIALLFATPGTGWGGMEKHVSDLGLELARRGHSVHVMAHGSYQARFPAKVHFHPLPVQCSRLNPRLRFALRQCIRRIKPDVLHSHGNKAAQLAGRMAPDLAPLRVSTVHGIKKNHKAFLRQDTVIAVSPWVFENLEHGNKHLIYNGIAIDRAPRADDHRAMDVHKTRAQCIAVGRLEPVKGFHTLIEAWSQLVQPAQLTIYGEGSERPRLERLIDTLNLQNDVTLFGYCEDLQPIYRDADLTIISSEREGFSYVLIEALAADCPVASTPVAGPLELLPESALSADGSEQSLRAIIDQTLSDLPGTRQAQMPAMQRIKTTFTIEAMVDNIERLYREAMT
ncbi:glycosyltransferase [Marinobacter alexandrii]|uniref:glycosyltransferase n=1 Tax=Marinobacter alexandrii TaxID=2570351 RepID=UPI001109A1A7|nr:glycosyltransferase [Marinobacter alexandrii]